MKSDWNLEKYVYSSDLSIHEIIEAIRVLEVLKTKYPKDEIIATSIDILRNEACNMFGGSIILPDGKIAD
jgi:hypothetical protein